LTVFSLKDNVISLTVT